jgi:hypothetical protein
MPKRSRQIPCAVVCLALLTGCGGNTAPVTGRVKFNDGSDAGALARYQVVFESEADKVSASGNIQPDGSFMLSTYGMNDGAVPGKHRVAIKPPASPDPDKPPPRPAIPPKYFDPTTSGLSVEIKPGQNSVELEVERVP